VRSTWLRLGLAALAGLAVTAGFAPYQQQVALLAGLALLTVCLDGVSARSGGLVGLVFGVAFMATLMPWLQVVGTDAWLGVAVLEGSFYAVYGAGHALLRRWPGWPVWAACWWVAVEAARGRAPLGGFPWGRLAFSVPDGPFSAWPRWVGVPATSGLVLLTGCLLGAAALWALPRRTPVRAAAVPAIAALGLVAVSPLLPTGLAEPDGSVSVALVQGGVPGTGAEGAAQQRAVVGNHVQATRDYAAAVAAGQAAAADVVIWPENGTDIDPFVHPTVGADVQGAVDAVGVPTLIGAIVEGPAPGQAQNTGIVWQPGTGPGERYVKRHLVPFGEYIPFRSQLAPYISRLDQIPRDMVPGDEAGVLRLGPFLVGDLLCFDVAYDDAVRDLSAAVTDGGAQLLVVQTNNATYLGTGQPAQQWEISRVAATLAGRDLVVASVNGISGVASADGATLQQSRSGVQEVLTAQVRLASGVTWGVRAGGWLELVVSGLGLLAVVGAAARPREGRPEPAGDGAPTAAPAPSPAAATA
jgi:apolipoprotein N-acyltransferase